MGTGIRPETSKKNRYWIERHRYYELKHFCLQYPIWEKAYRSLSNLYERPMDLASFIKSSDISDPTAKCAIARAWYADRIEMVRRVARQTDEELQLYILKGITEGVSYECLNSKYGIPCCKDTYYDRYRKFFWILNKERD